MKCYYCQANRRLETHYITLFFKLQLLKKGVELNIKVNFVYCM